MLDVGTGAGVTGISRFTTVASGGMALDDAEAQLLLRAAGLLDVRTAASPRGVPVVTMGGDHRHGRWSGAARRGGQVRHLLCPVVPPAVPVLTPTRAKRG